MINADGACDFCIFFAVKIWSSNAINWDGELMTSHYRVVIKWPVSETVSPFVHSSFAYPKGTFWILYAYKKKSKDLYFVKEVETPLHLSSSYVLDSLGSEYHSKCSIENKVFVSSFWVRKSIIYSTYTLFISESWFICSYHPLQHSYQNMHYDIPWPALFKISNRTSQELAPWILDLSISIQDEWGRKNEVLWIDQSYGFLSMHQS